MSKKQQQIVSEITSKYNWDVVAFQATCDSYLTSDRNKKPKFQSNLIVVSRFRIFSFSKGKTLEKELHLLNLTEISGRSKRVVLSFNASGKISHLVIDSEYSPKIVYCIRESFRKITFGWPNHKLYRYDFEGSEDLVDFDPGYASGFGPAYEASCNLLGLPLKQEVMDYVHCLSEKQITEFEFNSIPGVELRTELSFDLLPIAYALKNNTYFRSVIIRDVEQKDAINAISVILSENRSLTKVVCSNCSSEVSESLGQSLLSNQYHKVRHLDLSGNKFLPKAAESLALAFQHCPHLIEVVNLSNVGLSASALQTVTNALSINWGLSLGIEELNLSNNQMFTASNDLIQFMSHMRRHSKLKKLSLANTGISIGSLILELGFLKLTYLDFSDNKFDKLTQTNLSHFCEATKTLETIRLANTGLSPQVLGRMVSTLSENESLKCLSIDISRNGLGPQGISCLTPYFKNIVLNGLDLSDNGLKEKGCVEVLKSIKSVKRLVLDHNWKEEKDVEEFATALGSFIHTHPELRHLSITGSTGCKLGKGIRPFFASLHKNESLEELDFTGNAVGDVLFSLFCSFISTSNLKRIRCDNNSITHGGYMCMRRVALKSPNLACVEFPTLDFEADSRSKTKFIEVLLDITRTISLRGGAKWDINPFTFNSESEILGPVVPLLVVPPELVSVAQKLYDGPLPTLPVEEEVVALTRSNSLCSTALMSEDVLQTSKSKKSLSKMRRKSKRDVTASVLARSNTLESLSSIDPIPPSTPAPSNLLDDVPSPSYIPAPPHSVLPPPSSAPPLMPAPPSSSAPPPLSSPLLATSVPPTPYTAPVSSTLYSPPPPTDVPVCPLTTRSQNVDLLGTNTTFRTSQKQLVEKKKKKKSKKEQTDLLPIPDLSTFENVENAENAENAENVPPPNDSILSSPSLTLGDLAVTNTQF